MKKFSYWIQWIFGCFASVWAMEEAPPVCSSLPTTSNSNVPVFTADYLFLSAREGGLDYATQSPIFTVSTPTVLGTVYAVDPGFSSGVQFRGDYFIPQTPWDVKTTWMYYQNKQSASLAINDGIDLIHRNTGEIVLWPYLLNPALDPLAKTANATWKLNMNVLDVVLGGECFALPYFSLQALGGVRAAWINQQFNVLYGRITFLAGGLGDDVEASILSNNTNNFGGAGLLAGLEAKGCMGQGFSFLAHLSSSLLWGTFKISQIEVNADSSIRSNLQDSLSLLSPVIDAVFQIAWEHSFKPDQYFLNVHVGWKQQFWFGQNQLNYFYSWALSGDAMNQQEALSLGGFVAGASFGF